MRAPTGSITIAFIAAITGLKVHRIKQSFPEEAKVENLRKRYHDLLDKLEHAIDNNESIVTS